MHPRHLVCITLLAACHLYLGAQTPQVLINTAPGPAPAARQQVSSGMPEEPNAAAGQRGSDNSAAQPNQALPDDPGQELMPQAVPVPEPSTGVPVQIEAGNQTWNEQTQTWTLSDHAVIHYRGYVIRADNITYNRATTELEADGHLEVTGGPNDVSITATHGDMRLNTHTARFYNVSGSQGMRTIGRTSVFTTTNPLLFSGRVLLETGEGHYRIVDGSMTNCRLPHPDWRIIAHSISLNDKTASMSNAAFKFLGIPVFYFPYLQHRTDETGRVSGLLIPVASNSSIEGYVIGEQVYWVINRSMDAVIGTQYFSKRGWAPNGDFRYRGPGLDHVIARWNSLFDRGVQVQVTDPQTRQVTTQHVNQGGIDASLVGRKDFSSDTRIAGVAEYLSSYVYRLIFNDNYSQATSSEVASEIVLTHNHNGIVSSGWLDRFQSFAGTAKGDEVRILRLPLIRYDALDRPLVRSPFYWNLGSSVGYLNRSEPNFHPRNVVRLDFYPHLSLPINGAGWSILPEVALRATGYTISQTPSPDPTGGPTVSHDPLDRKDLEASVDIRPPALERDFELPVWHRELRHVIEPALNYRFVGGIGARARNALLFDTTDVATDVNEAGFTLTQRFYLRPTDTSSCVESDQKAGGNTDTTAEGGNAGICPRGPREWATWEIAQEYFIDPNFGGALIPGRRNVFDATLQLMAPTFLTSPRNLAPVVSRIRFEAIDNLRIQWDLAYDTIAGDIAADNVFAGYSVGRTTMGISHALLNAPDETTASGSLGMLKSQQIQPFFEFGKPSRGGFNAAVDAGYDFVQRLVQYAGVQAVYNWNCCGLSVGYRRFELGTVGSTSRDETQWLYGFTLANFGNVGDIRRTNSVFRDPTLPPAY
jgi:LPS-assembly protein